jgi:16S rRNA (guanine527-N7)-methyltransferase
MINIDVITNYFPNLTARQIDQFDEMRTLYLDWNEKINVISRKDISELYVRHVLHSLSIAKIISFVPQTRIVDVGCGGGFPGIPLAVLFPEVQFTLVDSIGKKIKVVNEVAQALGLTNVVGIHSRSEDIKGTFDFVVSRAVTAFPQFVAFSKHLVASKHQNALPNGILYLKGGDFSDELKTFGKTAETFDITDFFKEEFFETKKIIYLPIN